MQEFDKIGEDLFNKIRGRFPEVTIGDKAGTVTNEPTMARFFDFDYNGLGKVSVAIDEDEGLTIIYSKDFMEDQDEMTQDAWYDFLKELRIFSKKRMLDYSVRDITKSNLNKRDYKFLAKTPEDGQMTESKLYGTSKISYQKVGEARIVIQHTESINQESATGRTQKIGKIYIESADGERFRYPFKHLSGARAMARHVAEGGNTYDDFGKHIVGLSEEMGKLRKFKNYMGRSAVMAESLAGYVDVVKERIATVKKTIESLQKPAYYAETIAAFETPMMEDVPADVAENWIDQLTIKQFNEELADVFPYIYKLVGEATRAKSLGPDDLVDEGERHGNSKIYDKCRDGWRKKPGATRGSKGSCIPEEIELEQGFEEMMGQFGEERTDEFLPALAIPALITAARIAAPKLIQMGAKILTKGAQGAGAVAKGAGKVAAKNPGTTAAVGGGAYVGKKAGDAIDAVGDMAGDLATSASDLIAKAEGGVEAIQGEISAFLGGDAVKQVAAMASKYALPALAVVALLYGGKKVIDMLKSKDDDQMQTASMEEDDLEEAYIKTSKDASDALGVLRGKGKKIETGDDEYDGNLANEYASDVWDVYSWIEARTNGFQGIDPKFQAAIDAMMELRKEAKKLETQPGSGKNGKFGNQIVNTLYPVMQYIDAHDFDKKEDDGTEEPEEQKTPLGEFILSYFDRETGVFPKGETAVLTMIEKDYGEQFIEPAKAFIEQIGAKFEEFQMRNQPQQMEASGPCHHCSGSGHEMGNPGKACLDCGGTGKSAEKNEDAVDENFTQAAAAAARAHKTEFEYPKGSGKMHPVKMDKGTAHEINDDFDRMRELAGLR